jgi:PAS domain S-box-containing protein
LINESRVAPRSRAHSTALWRAPILAFVIAFLATGGLASYLARSIEDRNKAAFDAEVARAMEAIYERVAVTTTLLRGASGLFAASDHVDRHEFAAYVERLRLRQSYPGILGIGFTQRIDPDSLDDVVREARAEGVTDFRVWPDDPRNEYHSILYIEPMDRRNQAALGFDMFTEATRREAMESARDTGEIAASGPVLLVQEIDADKQTGFLLYTPVYDAPGTPSDVEQRRRLLRGFVYSPLRIGDLIAGTRGHRMRPVDLELFDAGATTETLLYSNRSADDAERQRRFVAEQTMYVAGRQWVARFGSRPEFEFISYWYVIPWLVLAVLSASLLLGGITYVQARAGRDARRAAARQRAAAEALHLEREWLRTTLTSIGDAVIAVDGLDRIVLMNSVAERLTGWSQREAQGRARHEVVRTDRDADTAAPADAVSGELMLLSRDGRAVPVEHSTAPIRDPAGVDYGAVVVMRDVTERQRAESALRASEEQARDRSERLHALAAATPALIGAGSVEALVAAVENEARRLLGAPRAWLLVDGSVGPQGPAVDDVIEVAVIGREGDAPAVLRIAHRPECAYDGDDHVLLSQLAGIAAIALSNVRLTEELRAADRRKDEFLATLAHELRNPLAPICNSLEIMRRHPGGEPAERARAVASRQAWHMVRLIDDLLDLSRISRGTIVLQRQRMAIAAAIETALEASEPLITSREHALVVAPLPRDLLVDGDATRLAQVFSNLLNNAANYTDPGGRIELALGADDDTIRIAVRDNGVGIDPQQLSRVFDLFMQAERGSGRDSGLGIGLTLVRRLVEMHGGHVEAHSAGRGQGAEFVVLLPRITDSSPS